MKGQNVLRAMLVMVLLAMVFAVPASADKPEIVRSTIEEDGIDSGCVTFDLDYHSEWKVKYTLWSGEKGNAPGDTYIAQEFTTIYYGGRELTFHSQPHYHFTWISPEQTLIEFSGTWAIATVPGHGIARATTGSAVDLETCHEEGEEWVCETEWLHSAGLDFVDGDVICNYMLTGE